MNGTLPSDYYGYMGLSSLTSNYNNEPGIAQSQLQNLDLSWETNYNLNFGLDFGFWNRLNFTLEYYTRTTKDLLMDRPISMTTGFGSYLMNIGEVKNRVWNWRSVPSIYENGNYIKDITEEINKAHAIVLDKHAEPNAIGGLSNTLRYKWFDLNFMFSYQFGGYSYDNWAQKTEHGGNDLEANIPSYYKDSWKKPGDVTKYELFYEKPSVAMNKVTTTRRLHSTDFIRLNRPITSGHGPRRKKKTRIGWRNPLRER